MKYNKIIFVCSSDTCRSPMAEGIMKTMLLERTMQIESRGVVVLFPEPMNQKAVAVMKSNGVELQNHMSMQLKEEDFAEDCLVIVMEERLKEMLLSDYKNARNVYKLTELTDDQGDVENPYGGALSAYGYCFEMLRTLIEKLTIKLNKEEL